LGGAGALGYVHYNRSGQLAPRQVEAASPPGATQDAGPSSLQPADRIPAQPAVTEASPSPIIAAAVEKPAGPSAPASAEAPVNAGPVNVVLTAHAPAWIQVTADGKTAFVGTLQADDTKNISAAEQVKVLTGNAGALTISLNGKILDSLGPVGQVRSVRLTAAGPAPVLKDPPPPPDAL